MAGSATATAPTGTTIADVTTRSLGLLALAVAGWLVAPLMGYPQLAWPALAVGLVASGAEAVRGTRQVRREEVLERLQLAFALEWGGRTGALDVRTRRWTRGWVGLPRQVRVRYAPLPAALAPDWAPSLASATSSVLSGTYKVKLHNPSRGRLELRLDESPAAKASESDPAAERARKVVTDLLGPTASVTALDLDESGQVTSIAVSHGAGAKLVASGYRSRIDRTVSALLPGRWRSHWDLEGDKVRFEQRPQLPDSIWLEEVQPPAADLMENYADVEIPFGVDEDGDVMSWRPALLPQAVVIGGTGSGKTSTTHALLVQFSHYGWPIWVADGKAIEFLGFRDWPNVQTVASTPADQVAVIHRAWELMEHRYSLVTRNQARIEDFEPLLLFVDEYADLKGALTSWYAGVKQKGDPRQPPTFEEVASIIRKGRTARVHIVLALQRPDVEFLGGEMRDNLGMRISVGRLSPQGAQMMWEHPAVGVTLPRGKRGRAIAMSDNGFPVEMQCFRTPDPAKATHDVELQLLERLRPAHSEQERLLIVPPEPSWNGDSDERTEPGFWDYAQADWVRAADRPELDPLATRAGAGLSSGRELSSAMSMLGLTGLNRKQEPAARPRLLELEQQLAADDGMSREDDAGGYLDPVPIQAKDVAVGDLVDSDGEWVVVEDDPVADVDDPDAVSIPWRTDSDEYGDLVAPADELIQVRHPKEI